MRHDNFRIGCVIGLLFIGTVLTLVSAFGRTSAGDTTLYDEWRTQSHYVKTRCIVLESIESSYWTCVKPECHCQSCSVNTVPLSCLMVPNNAPALPRNTTYDLQCCEWNEACAWEKTQVCNIKCDDYYTFNLSLAVSEQSLFPNAEVRLISTICGIDKLCQEQVREQNQILLNQFPNTPCWIKDGTHVTLHSPCANWARKFLFWFGLTALSLGTVGLILVSLLTQGEQNVDGQVEMVETIPELPTPNTGLCCVCQVKSANIVILECKHFVTCSVCVPNLKHCPICRATISSTMQVFL